MSDIPKIVERNRDIEHIMHASCKYGHHMYGKRNPQKQLALLVSADVHECAEQLESAIEYLNYYEAIDAGICLGDIQARNYGETDGTWYSKIVNKSKKPFLSIIGNHDVGNSRDIKISGTATDAFDKFFRATAPVTSLENYNKPYFVKYFDKYKLALVGLCNFEQPGDKDENGDFIIHTSECMMSQAQIDWFIQTLCEIPEEYHLMIAMHTYPYDTAAVDCQWTDPHLHHGIPMGATPYGNDNIISDIVDAWVRGSAFVCEYSPVRHADICPTLRVNCDFTKRGEGVFVSFIMGHKHRDLILKSKKYEYQNIICFPATANDFWQNFCSDLPREIGTKAEDALTVMSVCTEERQIRLVRIGSDMTMDMTERRYFVLKY